MRIYLLLIITVSAAIVPQDVGFEVASVKRNISGPQQARGGIGITAAGRKQLERELSRYLRVSEAIGRILHLI